MILLETDFNKNDEIRLKLQDRFLVRRMPGTDGVGEPPQDVSQTLILFETDFNKNDEIRLSGFVSYKTGFWYFHKDESALARPQTSSWEAREIEHRVCSAGRRELTVSGSPQIVSKGADFARDGFQQKRRNPSQGIGKLQTRFLVFPLR